MKIHNVAQGSVDWSILRAGIPTASEFGNLLTDGLEIRKGEMPQTYLDKKLAEWWKGGPLAEFNSFDMEQGRILEDEAIPFLELTFDRKIEKPGFITTNDGRAGCSPDGMFRFTDTGDLQSGLEIKCPRIETHIGYLRKGALPKTYWPQVHGSMFVTNIQTWVFVSYRRHLPPLILTIERDDKSLENIREALDGFWYAFEKAKRHLCELNGGPPKRFSNPPLVAPLEPITP